MQTQKLSVLGLDYDMEYARRWSLIFDLKILALTLVRFRDPNAY